MRTNNLKKIVLACSGASGMLYAKLLIDKLSSSNEVEEIALVFTENAIKIWESELQTAIPATEGKIELFANNNFYAPFASGSSQYYAMIICPSSMGMVARIANGISDCLISRAADVILKEQRKLILVPRETPYNLIHIKNMERIISAGGVICPATPSFYSNPKTIEQLSMTVVDRIIDLIGISNKTFRWGRK
ncbi:MAG TPA: UbiX family flavin prenyltransferase [Salinivirgaceae bacterium]|nr:UbiX family flavin prenyltransferase [Salinivirgaceae bacterium]